MVQADSQVQWQTASPLWTEALKDTKDKTRFRQPALLRFAGDTFMEDLAKLLNRDASKLKTLVAQVETWESEASGWLSEDELAGEKAPLKLFQPAHNRFYLVAASLVCRKPGLPDKCIYPDREEKVSFVLRRLVPVMQNKIISGYDEYGWQKDAGWARVDSPASVPDEEERFPMFPMNFSGPDMPRRLLAGFIPASSRETFQAAAKINPFTLSREDQAAALASGDDMANLPLAHFESGVVEGMAGLREILKNTPGSISGAKAQEAFLFALLDFSDFIGEYLNNDLSSLGSLNSSLFAQIGPVKTYWSEALNKVGESNNKEKILTGAITDLSFILPQQVTADDSKIKDIMEKAIAALNILTTTDGGKTYTFSASFKSRVKAALKNSSPAGGAQPGGAAAETTPDVPKYETGVYYTLRCVYERPRCKGIQQPVVSQPSRRFQMATFFEPEAPTRPVRIVMPADASVAGLRKFKKNVAVLFSDKLRNQIDQIKNAKVKDIDEGDIETESGWSLGMICSLSIPIITICAMILLMIFVKLLNIVFWWMPFFKICFPIPKKN